MRQECILLRFVKAMDFIHKQDGAASGRLVLTGTRHRFANVFDPAKHGRDCDEVGIKAVGEQSRQCGFTHARRPPEQHGMRPPGIQRGGQWLARPKQMALPNHLLHGGRAQPLGQWRVGIGRGQGIVGRFDRRVIAKQARC